MNESNLSDDALAELLTLTMTANECGTIYRNHLGQFHRVHGPAVILSSGSTMWFQNGKRHRTDGPAVIYPTGGQFWYLNDEQLTEGYFNERAKSV